MLMSAYVFSFFSFINFCFMFSINFKVLYDTIGFQSPATPIMEGIIDLHNYIFFFLIMVFVIVFYIYIYILYKYYFLVSKLSQLFNFDDIVNSDFFSSDLLLFFFEKLGPFFIRDQNIDNKVFTSKLVLFDSEFEMCNFFREILSKIISYIDYHVSMLLDDILITRKIVHGTLIEIIWTIIPSIILVFIAIPSFTLLYAIDELNDPQLTVKVLGYQWFWTYEYAQEFDIVEFDYFKDALGYSNRFFRKALVYDSVMIPDNELTFGYHRLLDVDHQMILPVKTHVRIMVTAADVLHSWAVPSLGIKIDAVPGRMSQVGLFIKREGVFYGQCSELCGVNHGFMPIAVKVVSLETFLEWYRQVEFKFNEEFALKMKSSIEDKIDGNKLVSSNSGGFFSKVRAMANVGVDYLWDSSAGYREFMKTDDFKLVWGVILSVHALQILVWYYGFGVPGVPPSNINDLD